MRAPSVIIIASPYEGELLSRALADTGLRVLRADGGDGAHALIATELPLAVVIGTSLIGADPTRLVDEARARSRSLALFLLADVDDPVATALRPRVTATFRRPTDFDILAHEIELLAVAVERADLAEVELVPQSELEELPPPIPRVSTQPIWPPPALSQSSRPSLASSLLRVDDALAANVAVGPPAMMPTQVNGNRARAFERRSTIAREIEREVSQAERRLFPGEAPTPSGLGTLDDFDDALGDIDLDSLAIDTVPGLAHGFGLDDRRAKNAQRATVAPPAARLVQEEGDLAHIDVAELVARIQRGALSGALEVERPDGPQTVYFDHGDLVGARAVQRHAQLGEMLFREGKLTREQAATVRAADASAAEGLARPIALRLVEMGLLKESELFPVVRRHAEEIFYSLFSLQAGRYRLGSLLPAADDRVRMASPTSALLMEGIRRKYGLERLNALLKSRDAVLHPTTAFPREVERASLSSDERRAANLIDGERTLGDVRVALGGRVPESALFGVAWGLHVLGALETSADADDLRYASTVITTDTGERRAQPRHRDDTRHRAEQGVERERIVAKRAQILDADYFTVLGVSRDASDHELQRAHARLRADFDGATLEPETVAAHGDDLAEIRVVLDEALRVLSVRSVRDAYAAHLAPEPAYGANDDPRGEPSGAQSARPIPELDRGGTA